MAATTAPRVMIVCSVAVHVVAVSYLETMSRGTVVEALR